MSIPRVRDVYDHVGHMGTSNREVSERLFLLFLDSVLSVVSSWD